MGPGQKVFHFLSDGLKMNHAVLQLCIAENLNTPKVLKLFLYARIIDKELTIPSNREGSNSMTEPFPAAYSKKQPRQLTETAEMADQCLQGIA